MPVATNRFGQAAFCGDGRRPIRLTAKPNYMRTWRISVGSSGCAQCLKLPHQRRRTSAAFLQERKTLTADGVKYVKRIKGPLFVQGFSAYEPMYRCRLIRLKDRRTRVGRPLPAT